MVFQRAKARLSGFRRHRRHKKWRPKGRRTPPAGTVSQPIGKPFNGQAKGLLWLTWRSYAGPPQYFIPPEGGALNPSGRRQPIPDRTLGAQGRQARRRHQPSRQKTTVGRLNGRPFYGQAKGQLRPTCTSYAGCAHQPTGILVSTVPIPTLPVFLPGFSASGYGTYPVWTGGLR